MAKAGLLVLALLALAQGGPEPGEETEAMRALRRRAAYDRVRARFLRDEEASILKGLRTLETSIEKARREAVALEARIAELDLRLAALADTRAESTGRLAALRARAGRRAAAMLRLRRTSVSRLLAHVERPVEARRLKDRLRFALEHDAELRREARRAASRARAAEAELEKERAAEAAARAELEATLEDQALLEEERRALATAVREERRVAERLARELSAAARQLEQEMTRIRGRAPAPEPLPGGFRAQRGRLPWPVEGRVEVAFGKRVEPSSDVVLESKGIDLRAELSAPVRAVFPGRVVFADRFEGFGRMLVLAHDGGFFTLYAHLSSFAAAVGGELAQHQVLGFVGETGSTKGPYLYFEIRRGETPLDPLRWLDREG